MATAKAVTTVEAIFNEASLLPLNDRAQLADVLLSSSNQSPLSPAWKAEIDLRLAAYDRGEAAAVSGEQVIQLLKEKYSV